MVGGGGIDRYGGGEGGGGGLTVIVPILSGLTPRRTLYTAVQYCTVQCTPVITVSYCSSQCCVVISFESGIFKTIEKIISGHH